METFIHLELIPEMISPALVGKPQSGLTKNEFNQLTSELEIIALEKTLPIGTAPREILRNEIVARMVRVSYDYEGGGFCYGIRDYVKGIEKDGDFVAIKEANFTSLRIWEDFGHFSQYEK